MADFQVIAEWARLAGEGEFYLDPLAVVRLPAFSQQFSFQIPWSGAVRVKTVGWGKSAGVWGVGSEALLHEAHEVIPVIEREVL